MNGRSTGSTKITGLLLFNLLLIAFIGGVVMLSYIGFSMAGFQEILIVVSLLVFFSSILLSFKISMLGVSQATNIVLVSVLFGIISGIGEGLLFVLGEILGRIIGSSFEIIWISPVANLLIFSGIGCLFALISIHWPNRSFYPVVIFLCLLLTILDWFVLLTNGKIHILASLLLAAGISAGLARRILISKDEFFQLGRRVLPWGVASVVFLLIAVQSGVWLRERIMLAGLPESRSKSPNILFIVVDALRSDHLSSYGYARQTSPNIDALAAQGVVFNHSFSGSSYTLPSHVSLLTGLYTHEHGIEWDTPKALFKGSFPTIAEVLKENGYRTGAFSGNTFWFTREEGFGRGFIHFDDFFTTIADMALRTFYGRGFEQHIMRRVGLEDIPARKRASDINQAVIKWVERDPAKPFFVFINFMDVHDPYLPPQPFRSQFTDQDNDAGGILNWRVGRTDPILSPEQLQSEMNAYDGAIAYTDSQISILLDRLKSEGYMDNTLVVLTSDHGEAFGEHNLFLHAHSLYREVIEVPLIMTWPGVIPAGKRIDRPVSNVSLPTTILNLLKMGNSGNIAGQSLVRLWEDDHAGEDWPMPLSELAQQPWALSSYPVQHGWIKSLVSPEWHLIEYETLEPGLYRWEVDPREANNLAINPENRPAMSNLHDDLWARLQLR